MIVYRLMEFARGDGADLPAFVRGNENGSGERHGCQDIHDKIRCSRLDSAEVQTGSFKFFKKNNHYLYVFDLQAFKVFVSNLPRLHKA